MKNVGRVLMAIDTECSKQTKFAEISCFDKIADKAEVPRPNLCLYLNELQERGYIKYSLADKYICITQKGRDHVGGNLR